VVEHVYERGDRDALVARLHTHRQLVAEVARRRAAHAGNAQMLAQVGDCLHVEVVEGDDAVEPARARQITHGIGDVGLLEEVDKGHRKELVDSVARPGFVFQVLRGDQNRVTAEAFALL
jgi:hypothetical protein